MSAKDTGNKAAKIQELEALVQIMEECPFPILRLDPNGKPMFSNSAVLHQEGLVDKKNGKLSPSLTDTAITAFAESASCRLDVNAGEFVYDMYFNPVVENGYVNVYGRDVTRIRKADKKLADAAKFPSENPNPVLRVERDGTVLLANSAARAISGVLDPGPPEALGGELVWVAEDAIRTNENQQHHLVSGDRVFLFTVSVIENESYLNIYGREITAEREAEAALEAANRDLEKRVADRTASVRLLQNILLAANSAESFEAALQAALHEICLFANWSVGHAYVVEEGSSGKNLVPTGIWHVEKGDGFASLRDVTEKMRFGDPDDLPGWVITRGQARWIEELEKEDNFPRLEFTRQAGLKSGMAFPVTLHEEVIGVLEFFALEVSDPDLEIIKTLGHVGAQLGSVAERKRAEAALAASQADAATAHSRLTAAIESIGQSFILYDADDRVVLFNQRANDMLSAVAGGVSVRVGEPFEAILRRSRNPYRVFSNEDEREAWVQRVLAGRRAKESRVSTDRFSDGRWYRSEGFATSDGGLVSVFTDITESKTHETELQKLLEDLGEARDEAVESQREAATAHSRLTDALEVINQAIVLFDADNDIVLFNRKYSEAIIDFTGVSPNIGDSYEKILHGSAAKMHADMSPEERDVWVRQIIEKRREQKVRRSEDQTPSGRWMMSEGFATANGGTVSVFTDVTEVKEHEAEMQELLDELGVARDEAVDANAAKSQFLANMSHELRTPLNAIIGYSELLIEDLEDDAQEDYVPDLVKIQKAGKHLLGLINDVLDLAKVEVGEIELFVEEINVRETLGDVSNTILPLLNTNNNTLQVDIAKGVGTIFTDHTKLRQNLFNLLSNATKFSKDSEILVRIWQEEADDGDIILFEITDQGIGMNEEQLAKVFQPFQQADVSTSKEFGGTGLGLTITREFCRKMGGDVAVESTPGKGSVFTMSIRVNCSNDKAPEPVAQVDRLEAVSDDAPLVLIIDDDAGVRDLLCRNLNAAGYHTWEAANGATGLKLAEELQPDIITLDVVMPQVDGWSVLGDLKANSKTQHIPIVMVTIVDDKNLAFSLGASEYLAKPVDRAKLTTTIERLTRGKKNQTVLIVEDDPETREVLRRHLTKNGVKTEEAENGRIGLERIEAANPDLILLDLMMPEMDGFEFIEKYRERPEWHEIPVVVLTAKILTEEDRKRLNGWVQKLYGKDERGVESILDEISRNLKNQV